MDFFYSCENNEKQLGAVICPQHSCSSLRHFYCQVYIPARNSAWMVAFRVPSSSDILALASVKSQLFKLSAALCTEAAGKWSCLYVKPSLALEGSRQKWHGDNFFTYHIQTYQASLVRSVRHHRKYVFKYLQSFVFFPSEHPLISLPCTFQWWHIGIWLGWVMVSGWGEERTGSA